MLSITNVSFRYNERAVLNAVSARVHSGDCLAIVGESGSGKSTLLKLIFGQMDVDGGTIFWKDQAILGPKNKLVVGHDFMKYVAQEFDLMPYTSVFENIGDHLSNFYPDEKKARVKELIEVVELEGFENTKVQFLSGGQKQRVALARAIAKRPEIILLDEPFSHIDNFKKQSLRRNLFDYLKTNNIACVLATHDKNDVLSFADQMMVLHGGSVLVTESPSNIYSDPRHPLVAAFFGEYSNINGEFYYAHQITLVDDSLLKATVKHSFYKGHYYLIEADLNGVLVCFKNATALKEGSVVSLTLKR
ncbi:ABC transporter, ATP-binding protein [Formosa sp. Hel1_33_131]|jgi:ABC-type sulfate/molybdate transport systems ATPase subunit|uniref:ABC transporter ATP-binding protein n=1 Tax=Formosa sp. Hel1_33_131 TaxID=1336794 RepID=UPI00084E121F|nr:ABC transporter ATP-binding protein [Formosa sp. Hel1_33_131]AOR28285.1 ABC transporter, ATP-binding protein [Formosa sp. Hel1_33_131]